MWKLVLRSETRLAPPSTNALASTGMAMEWFTTTRDDTLRLKTHYCTNQFMRDIFMNLSSRSDT